MGTLEQAVQTQIDNIQKKTGRSFDELSQIVRQSGLNKHSELVAMLKRDLSLGHGDANALVHAVLQSDGTRSAAAVGLSGEAFIDQLYSGQKAALRPLHTAVMAVIDPLGEFETLPKKGYVSLRRRKQFAMLGPATNTRVDLGLNVKSLSPDPRLIEQPAGSMCNYIIRLTDPGQVDDVIAAWIRLAFESAG